MLDFHQRLKPITSRPHLADRIYQEHLPCEALRPYVSCYWGGEYGTGAVPGRGADQKVLVIPDTCMDIVVRINHTKQTITGYLCSIQDEPFISVAGEAVDRISMFAVRFYFWAGHLFFNLDFQQISNGKQELCHLGREWEQLFEPFFYLDSEAERIGRVEGFLLGKLNGICLNARLFQAFHQMIWESGKSVKEICQSGAVSQRQLERQFLQTVGLPMKRVANLVRYQNVWRELAFSEQFCIQDAVYRYGYTDQSHLLREFKRFHGTTPTEARRIADECR